MAGSGVRGRGSGRQPAAMGVQALVGVLEVNPAQASRAVGFGGRGALGDQLSCLSCRSWDLTLVETRGPAHCSRAWWTLESFQDGFKSRVDLGHLLNLCKPQFPHL